MKPWGEEVDGRFSLLGAELHPACIAEDVSQMAVSINWGSFKGSYRVPLKGFEVDIRQA